MMSASTSITSGFDALVTPNTWILNAPIRSVSLLKLSGGVVGVGDGYKVASGRKLNELWEDYTQPPDMVMRMRIENIVKTYLGFISQILAYQGCLF